MKFRFMFFYVPSRFSVSQSDRFHALACLAAIDLLTNDDTKITIEKTTRPHIHRIEIYISVKSKNSIQLNQIESTREIHMTYERSNSIELGRCL